MHGPIPAVVRQLRLESDTVVSVELERVDGAPLPAWAPGAHIDLRLPNGHVRQYSLCGPRTPGANYRIGVLREEASSGGSEYVHTFLRPGQRVGIGAVRNHFELQPAPHHVFIAGGIGITPIYAMIDSLAADASWHLYYAGRSRRTMAFADELEARFPDRVTVATDDSGRFLDLDAILAEAPPGTAVHSCGPRGLLDALTELAPARPHVTVHTERFAATDKGDLVNTEHVLHCRRSDRKIDVPADKPFLVALREAGLHVESSCANGLCGTCEVRVLEGTPDHRDDILSGPARDRTDVMYVCVSRAVDRDIVLDL
ncbi:PDR/VanB family oxidoreductase [Pseudonocardia alni]|uniref:PDR/VanB family oxidoreductase n=1 Tax=Pseudonocardia alni TaxID=33907 RepID=UPI0033CB2BDF